MVQCGKGMPPFPSPFAPIHMQTGHTNIGWDRAPPPLHPHPCVHMNGGAHRMGHAPPFTRHPHFCSKGAGKGMPTPLLPPPTIVHAQTGCKHGAVQDKPHPLCACTPLYTNGGAQDGACPPFTCHPHFCTKGAQERYTHPSFALPPPSFMCKQDMNVGPCGTPPLPPLCPHANGGGAGRGNPLCRDGQGSPASA